MDVIADTGAIFRWVIIAIDLRALSRFNCCENFWNQVIPRIIAKINIGRANYVEIAK